MDEEVIKFARDKYKDMDILVNIFTMQIVWASDNVTEKLEYSKGELDGQGVRKVLSLSVETVTEIFSNLFSKGGKDTQTLKTKTGKKIRGTATIYSFTYEKEPHVVVSGAKFEQIKEKE